MDSAGRRQPHGSHVLGRKPGLLLAAAALSAGLVLQPLLKMEAGKVSARETTGSHAPAKQSFGKTKDGEPVDMYILKNDGITAKIINYGGIITELDVPDAHGKTANVVLGFDQLKPYEEISPYFGALVGRYANRIANAKFELDGKNYKLAANNAINTLHGGLKGFDKRIWHVEPLNDHSLKLTYNSADMEEGFPGRLSVTVIYTLADHELKIEYEAHTDKPTPVNLTSHGYFNLSGAGSGDILKHQLMIAADRFTPVDDNLIPTGKTDAVHGTAMDFTKMTTIGARIDEVKGGYDHNYVLRSTDGTLKMAAELKDPQSGRTMQVWTTEPGMQFYSGNFLDGTIHGLGGVYKKHYGLCLETQHFPDSMHHKEFPSVILHPGETYKQTTVYKFAPG